MSKVIESPVATFPGQVTLFDPLTFPMLFALEDAFAAVQAIEKPSYPRVFYTLLPGLLTCIQEWHIIGLPLHPAPESFPATPLSKRQAVAELIKWLLDEIKELHQDANDIPNA